MRQICFLSMDDLGDYVSDDELALEPLHGLGYAVSMLSWRQTELDWSDFEAVIIRSPWDYQSDPETFLETLAEIERSTARLENPLEIVRWNLDKRYLREMDERGVKIVPTIWDAEYSAAALDVWRSELGSDALIIKPTVSATAEHTYRLTGFDPDLNIVFDARSFMVQPFMSNIVAEGEYSLFYFNGEYSHAINKSPKPQDFRVQEEHGGIIIAIEPDQELRRVSNNTMGMIGRELLYARVDFVRGDDDRFCLMELELIEPALYLRMDSRAPERFARAVDKLLR